MKLVCWWLDRPLASHVFVFTMIMTISSFFFMKIKLCTENIDLIILDPIRCLKWSHTLLLFEKEQSEPELYMQKDENVIIIRIVVLLQYLMSSTARTYFYVWAFLLLFISTSLLIFLSPAFEAKVVYYYISFSCPKKWHRLKAKVLLSHRFTLSFCDHYYYASGWSVDKGCARTMLWCGFIFFRCWMMRGRIKLLHVVNYIFEPVNWPHHTNTEIRSENRFLNERRMLVGDWSPVIYWSPGIYTTDCIRRFRLHTHLSLYLLWNFVISIVFIRYAKDFISFVWKRFRFHLTHLQAKISDKKFSKKMNGIWKCFSVEKFLNIVHLKNWFTYCNVTRLTGIRN